MRSLALLVSLALAGCFAPPFPDAPATGSGHGHGGASAASGDPAHGDGHEGAAEMAARQGILVEGVCFEVRVPGDDFASRVKGMLYAPLAFDEATRVVLLLPGGASLAHVFDGEHFGYGLENGTTLPRALARNGYAVVAIDRLGLGHSPYAGSGARLSEAVQVALTDQTIAALRAGLYARGAGEHDECPAGEPAPFGSESVVLAGHSLGGWITMTYLGLHARVDGALILGAHSMGMNAQYFRKINECAASQMPADHVLVFCPGPDGYSPTCAEHMFHAPTAPRENVLGFCDNEELHTEPVGIYTDRALWHVGGAVLPSQAPAIPVHFVGFEFDRALEEEGPPARWRMEVERWETLCPCEVTSTLVPDIGHAFQFHSNYQLVNDDVLAWLASSGLGPRVGA